MAAYLVIPANSSLRGIPNPGKACRTHPPNQKAYQQKIRKPEPSDFFIS